MLMLLLRRRGYGQPLPAVPQTEAAGSGGSLAVRCYRPRTEERRGGRRWGASKTVLDKDDEIRWVWVGSSTLHLGLAGARLPRST